MIVQYKMIKAKGSGGFCQKLHQGEGPSREGDSEVCQMGAL